MISKRPININPLSIRLPVAAWVSISHRLSGVAIFFLIPLLLYLFQQSMASEASFNQLSVYLSQPWLLALVWILVASFLFHLLAGIRHILMDMHLGESLKAGRWSAIITFCVFFVLLASATLCLYWWR